jgi:Cd2+/Zn2+-exporting ATPase
MDKTGTLTEGDFRLTELEVVREDRRTVLQLLASVEQRSSHPIAVALCKAAAAEGATPSEVVEQYETIGGEGIQAVVGTRHIAVGNQRMAARMGWMSTVNSGLAKKAEKWEADGGTVCWIGVVDGPLLGVFSAADVPRPEAKEAIMMLNALGVRTVMCTGDGEGTAQAVGRALGVSEIRSKLRPSDKVDEVKLLKGEKTGTAVGMVGDGVNDAPALAAADIGIAMGATGTVVAMETADVALMDTDLRKLAKAVRLGRQCANKIRQNIAFSLVSKVAVIALTLTGHSALWIAIVCDVGAMLIVTLNGMTVLGSPVKRLAQAHGSHDHSRDHSHCHDHGDSHDHSDHDHGNSHDHSDHDHGHSHSDSHACCGSHDHGDCDDIA